MKLRSKFPNVLPGCLSTRGTCLMHAEVSRRQVLVSSKACSRRTVCGEHGSGSNNSAGAAQPNFDDSRDAFEYRPPPVASCSPSGNPTPNSKSPHGRDPLTTGTTYLAQTDTVYHAPFVLHVWLACRIISHKMGT